LELQVHISNCYEDIFDIPEQKKILAQSSEEFAHNPRAMEIDNIKWQCT